MCTWNDVYKREFIPHAQKAAYGWASRLNSDGSRTTWNAGRARALARLAIETYGEGSKPFRLISRKDHSAFKECARCKKLRLKLAELLKNGADIVDVEAMKALQAKHVKWFMDQREVLERWRQAGNREDTIFEQVCLYLRLSLICVSIVLDLRFYTTLLTYCAASNRYHAVW